jgi:hypothetical protein
MGPISQQTIEIVGKVPGFRDAVELAATLRPTNVVTARLSAVDNDPVSLYAMLEFARHKGVAVTFLPDEQG